MYCWLNSFCLIWVNCFFHPFEFHNDPLLLSQNDPWIESTSDDHYLHPMQEAPSVWRMQDQEWELVSSQMYLACCTSGENGEFLLDLVGECVFSFGAFDSNFYCHGTIPNHAFTRVMPTWNCKHCDMPLTTMNPDNYMSCPHCGMSMFQVEWLDSVSSVFQWSRQHYTMIETSAIHDGSNHHWWNELSWQIVKQDMSTILRGLIFKTRKCAYIVWLRNNLSFSFTITNQIKSRKSYIYSCYVH